MKIIFFAALGGILGSECPTGCDCQSDMAICYSDIKLTQFPDISRSPDIEELILVENEITNLPRLAHSLPRLKILNLSNNQLMKISRGSLPRSIEDAWMDDNKIRQISARIFTNLPNIMRIYLRNVSFYSKTFWSSFFGLKYQKNAGNLILKKNHKYFAHFYEIKNHNFLSDIFLARGKNTTFVLLLIKYLHL